MQAPSQTCILPPTPPRPFTSSLGHLPLHRSAHRMQMRTPGVEPGSQAWEACMMPLHYVRKCVLCVSVYNKCIVVCIISGQLNCVSECVGGVRWDFASLKYYVCWHSAANLRKSLRPNCISHTIVITTNCISTIQILIIFKHVTGTGNFNNSQMNVHTCNRNNWNFNNSEIKVQKYS